MTPHLPHAVVELVKLAAQHPEGVEPLFEGHLESVAALYQVHPSRVERVREAVSAPGARPLAEALAARATPRAPARAPHRPQPLDVATLIAEASIFPDGIALLTEAPLEMAAVRLGAHPFLVEEARTWLASRRRVHQRQAITALHLTPAHVPFTGDRAS